eukprot:g4656.t1
MAKKRVRAPPTVAAQPNGVVLGACVAVAAAIAAVVLAQSWWKAAAPPSSADRFALARVLDHDEASFTQGLVIAAGVLYESNGLYGESHVRKLSLDGRVLSERRMEKKYFAEGLDYWRGRLVQLTWREKVGFAYDADTLEQVQKFVMPRTATGEGWGITNNGTHLIVSDGSHHLYFWEASENLDEVREVGRVQVRHAALAREFAPLYKRLGGMINVKPEGDKVHFLNELEYVNGEVLANVWYADKVLRIAPDTGEVLGWHDFAHLHGMAHTGREDCLNGIAFDERSAQLYITGKQFNKLFVMEAEAASTT